MELFEEKSCYLLPQLRKRPNMYAKVGDEKCKKGLLPYFIGKMEKNKRKKIFSQKS